MSNKMSFAAKVMRKTTYNLIKNQCYIALSVAILAWVFFDPTVLLASLYGAFIALSGSLISSWRITRAGVIGISEKQQGYIEIYLGAIQRYILTLVLFALGIGALHLPAVPMIAIFALEQIAYLFITVDTGNKSNIK
jgi:ATP synthase protein I